MPSFHRNRTNKIEISSLDNILGSGLHSGELTEIYGLPGIGKTQVKKLSLSFLCPTL